MDLRSFLDNLRDRWRLLAVTTVLGLLGAAMVSMLATTMYTATATAVVSVTGGVGPGSATSPDGSPSTQDQVRAYVSAAQSDVVIVAVIDELDLPLTPSQLAHKIEVNNPFGTAVLQISATDPNPWLARAIANSATGQVRAGAMHLTAVTGSGDPLATFNSIQPASLPTSPSSPSTWTYLAVGFLVGLAMGVGATVVAKVAASLSHTRSLESEVS
jgi:tyrosine-protein kinase